MRTRTNERGFALIYMTIMLATLLLFSGLAIDSGRAYVVKAQLTKAVDGAALGAARALNSGDPRREAVQIFKANFPDGFYGVSTAADPTSSPSFFSSSVDATTGVNTVKVTASVVMPTTFMKLGNFNDVTVTSTGEATRRMVDLSLVIDQSSSIGWQWPIVVQAVQTFIDSFDGAHDRMSLITFGNTATVRDPMPAARGFDKTALKSHLPAGPSGSTNMVEGIYRGWDELRSVPAGTQSGLRIIVLFTDGASNGVPANWDGSAVAKSLRTYDFPKNFPDPDNQTWNNPVLGGLFNTNTGTQNPAPSLTVDITNVTDYKTKTILANPGVWPALPTLPDNSWHTQHRSPGIPTAFPMQTGALKVNGVAQSSLTRRGLIINPATTKPYASIWNVNNAARNVLEIIANEARNDNGDYKIRIYTIGMGELVRYNLGTMPEKPEDILKRISNDKTSPDYNPDQLTGMYFFAPTAADVGPAFQGIQNQILRLSK